MPEPRIYAFEDYELDLRALRLRRAGTEVRIQRKAFEVLRYLIEHRDRPVPRQELLEHVWRGDTVTPAVLTVAVSKARQAIGQAQDEDGPIRTEHGRGYRFDGAVATTPAEPAAAVVDHAARPAFVAPPLSPFVGRHWLMAQLRDAFARARRGHGQLFLLEGEPGVGKTRTAEELCATAAADGVETCWGRSRDAEGMPAFWPWVQIMRRCLRGHTRADVEAALGPAFAELCRVLPELAEGGDRAAPAFAESGHFRIFDAITQFVRLTTRDRPTIFVLDDLHWGDPPSLELLGYMLPELDGARLLIVGTLRDSELPPRHPIRMSVDYLTRDPRAHRVSLPRLRAADVDHYVAQVLGEAAPELSRAVYARCEGNAFFMTEALRTVTRDDSGALAVAELPDAALDLVRRRLLALPPDAEAVLAAAAVLGRSFDLGLLHEVTGRPMPELLALLQGPMDTQLIVARADVPDGFAFAHGLIRRALYDDMTLAERTRLHLRAGEALSARARSGASVAPAVLAHHMLRALPLGDAESAIDCACRAARAFSEVSAHEPAARHYELALSALRYVADADPQRRTELVLQAGHSYRLAGNLARARRAFSDALELGRGSREPRALALAAIGLRSCQPMRAVPEARVNDALSEALAALPDDEVLLRARVLARLSGQRPLETRRSMSARAAELVVGIEDPTVRFDVMVARLHAIQGPDSLDERRELADQILVFADRQEQPSYRWEALLARYEVALRTGDVAAAELALTACAEVADALSHPLFRLEVARLRMQRELCAGELERAQAQMNALAREGLRLQAPFAEFNYLAQSAVLYRDRGMLDVVVGGGEHFRRAFPWAAEPAAAVSALHAAEGGDLARARELYATFARDEFAGVLRGEDFVYIAAHLGQCAAALGDRPGCEIAAGMLAPYADQIVCNSTLLSFGSVEHALGVMDAALGRAREARAHLERAISVERSTGERAALVRSLIALGRLLDTRDRERARLLDEATELAREYAFGALLRETEALSPQLRSERQ